MRYLICILLLINISFAAEVNKKLFAESNASIEIQKINSHIANNLSTDPHEQNDISIQKLFLKKIEALANTKDKPTLEAYTLPAGKELSQKEFIDYFDAIAMNLNLMLKYTDNEKALHKRLYAIKENLKSLAPDQKNEILQGQLEYAYFKWQEIFNSRNIKKYKENLENEKKRFISVFLRTKIDVKELEKLTDKQNIELQNLYQKKVYLELRLEKETILVASKTKENVIGENTLLNELGDKDKNWKYNFVLDELKSINASISKVLKAKNNTLILRQINNLQKSHLESYIIVREVMDSLTADLSDNDKHIYMIEK